MIGINSTHPPSMQLTLNNSMLQKAPIIGNYQFKACQDIVQITALVTKGTQIKYGKRDDPLSIYLIPEAPKGLNIAH